MNSSKPIVEVSTLVRARFDSNCALIYLDFQNAEDSEQRRCVRSITAWKNVYFVQFYWGSPAFVSKSKYIPEQGSLGDDVRLRREFADPYLLQEKSKKDKSRHQTDPRWDKATHQRWIKEHELEVRLFWARKKYLDSGDPEELANVKANYALLGIEPFATPEAVRRAYHQEAKAFHPDQGGHEYNFSLLEKAYRQALEDAREQATRVLTPSGSINV